MTRANQKSAEDGIPRREVLATGAAAVAVLISPEPVQPEPSDTSARPTVYQRLGVKHVSNAAGTLTALGGSLMPPEVIAAWSEAASSFVDLVDLQNKIGVRLAELIGVPAALVTTGAAGALQLATAAVMTG